MIYRMSKQMLDVISKELDKEATMEDAKTFLVEVIGLEDVTGIQIV